MIPDPALLVLLQFADGLFPAGGFAHSFGLETCVQEGRVTDRTGLEAFIAAHLEGSSGPADAVAVALATRLAGADEVRGCRDVDERLDAMKIVPEFRAASRQMGRQTLRVAAALGDDPWLAALGQEVAASRMPGHHAVVFGAALGRAGIGPAAAAVAYLYSTSALLVGAGLRLIAMGQVDGQRALAAMRPRIRRLAAAAVRAGIGDMWSFSPDIEIAGIKHEALETRLFRS